MLACAPVPEPPEEPDEPPTRDDGGWVCEEGWHPHAMWVDSTRLGGAFEIDEGVVGEDGVESRPVQGQFVATYMGRMETRNDGIVDAVCERRTVWSGSLLLRGAGQTPGCADCEVVLSITPSSVEEVTDHYTVPTDCPPRVSAGPGGPGVQPLLSTWDGGALLQTPWMPLSDALDAGIGLAANYTLPDAVDYVVGIEPTLEPTYVGLVDLTSLPEDLGPDLAAIATPVEEGSDHVVFMLLARDGDTTPDADLLGRYQLLVVWGWPI